MSLRSSKVVLKNGIKNLSSGRFYTTTVKNEGIIFVPAESSQRPSNELLATNPQFPFQGGIGLDTSRIRVQAPIKLPEKKRITFKSLSKETTSDGRLRKRISELPDLIDSQMRIPELAPDYTPESEKVKIEVLKAERDMELKVTACPKLLKKELKTLFLDVEFGREKNFTVLNLTQKSVTDMSAWSPEMEVEREKLTEDFINIAISICSDLQKLGNGKYWADFIEPSSGRPYFGKYTNASLFETNDSYRELGFQIEDLGCCKVLKHVKWATHAFVGTIFTDAPMNSPEVKTILMNSKAGQYFQEKSEESEQII